MKLNESISIKCWVIKLRRFVYHYTCTHYLLDVKYMIVKSICDRNVDLCISAPIIAFYNFTILDSVKD